MQYSYFKYFWLVSISLTNFFIFVYSLVSKKYRNIYYSLFKIEIYKK